MIEKEDVNLIKPHSWNGLLLRNVCIYEEGHFVLKDINFSAKPGELVVVLGKSGAFIRLFIGDNTTG